jgi:hypothetical protein
MRTGKAIVLVAAILLAGPAAASAQTARDDERVSQDAAALPARLWEPGPEPVTAAGPSLPAQDGGGVTPILAALLLLAAAAAGYGTSRFRPAAARSPVP